MGPKLYGALVRTRDDVTPVNPLQVDSWTRLQLTKHPKDLYVMLENSITVDMAGDRHCTFFLQVYITCSDFVLSDLGCDLYFVWGLRLLLF